MARALTAYVCQQNSATCSLVDLHREADAHLVLVGCAGGLVFGLLRGGLVGVGFDVARNLVCSVGDLHAGSSCCLVFPVHEYASGKVALDCRSKLATHLFLDLVQGAL